MVLLLLGRSLLLGRPVLAFLLCGLLCGLLSVLRLRLRLRLLLCRPLP